MRHRLSLAALATIVLTPSTALAQSAEGGGTAPAYPGNTIKVATTGFVGGRVERVRLSGHANWGGSTASPSVNPYTISLYVQNAEVDSECGVSYSAQQQKVINLASLNATQSLFGFVVDDDAILIQPNRPDPELDWSIDSPPFAIRAGVRRVVLCAYVRSITDDVARYQLPVAVAPAACRAASGSVRRPTALKLSCNVSGAAVVRFTRGGRTVKRVSARVSSATGRLSVPTAGVPRGPLRVAISIGNLTLPTVAVRVR